MPEEAPVISAVPFGLVFIIFSPTNAPHGLSESTRRAAAQLGAPVGCLIAQVMAGVPAGMLAQVVLVILLGAVPGRGGLDARGDRPVPAPRRADARDDAFRDCSLLLRLREDCRAVLRPHVVALAVERRGVVQAEEPALE